MMGQMGTGALEFSAPFFIVPFPFLQAGKGPLGKISAQVYIFITHMFSGILNAVA